MSGKLVSDYQLNNKKTPILQRQNTCDIIYYYSILFHVGVMTIIVSHQVCACVSWNLMDDKILCRRSTRKTVDTCDEQRKADVT